MMAITIRCSLSLALTIYLFNILLHTELFASLKQNMCVFLAKSNVRCVCKKTYSNQIERKRKREREKESIQFKLYICVKKNIILNFITLRRPLVESGWLALFLSQSYVNLCNK